ncbi:MAG TPA: diaminopimelate decarboxylase [Burkholderiaceae bacterium]|nr:diaminopimelate decarboxylase [Burkholderiaceae bacterium]
MTEALPAAVGFDYRDRQLHCEDVAVADLAARFGTPLYVYSRAAITAAFRAYADALAGRRALVCYAMKANSNLAVLNLLARLGAGFDIVSGGELTRVLAAGGDPAQVVFSGVGKSEIEIQQALDAGILCFNIESAGELDRIDSVACALGRRARISVRVNPDVDARTHPYISTGLKDNKFGVSTDEALALYRRAARSPGLEVAGIDCHIGSQITEIAPYLDAAERVLDIVDAIERDGIRLRHIDFGGGLGIRYRNESPPATGILVAELLRKLDARGLSDRTVLFEPGRSIVGNAGILVTRVEYLKHGATRNFAIVDAAMNDLLRPTLYDAWMGVVPVAPGAAPLQAYDIVGPVCETGDWLARDRKLALAVGDLIAITGAGAYGMVMSSNYNTRPRAAEVLVDRDRAYCVRRRETVAELFAGESTLP